MSSISSFSNPFPWKFIFSASLPAFQPKEFVTIPQNQLYLKIYFMTPSERVINWPVLLLLFTTIFYVNLPLRLLWTEYL
jgi:hypothetical protein